jgi:hypothetical protein
LALWGLSIPSQTWAGHHAILAFGFLFVSMVYLIKALTTLPDKKIATLFLSLLCVTGAYPYIQLSYYQPHVEFNPTNRIVYNYLIDSGLMSESVVVTPHWGMYDFLFVYGPKDRTMAAMSLLAEMPENDRNKLLVRSIRGIHEHAASKNKKIIFVTLEKVGSIFHQEIVNLILPGFKYFVPQGINVNDPHWALWILEDTKNKKIDEKFVKKFLKPNLKQ